MAEINNENKTLLFVTASKYGDILCCQTGKDRKDFENYTTEQANEAIARKLVPGRLMCCFEINKNTELPHTRIDDPAKAKEIVTDLLSKNGSIANIHGIVSLPDAVYRIDRDLKPLPDEDELKKIRGDYDYIKTMNNYRDGLVYFLKQNSAGLEAVDTDGKILIFDKSVGGERSLKRYLQHQADAFFNPKNEVGYIKIYDLNKTSETLQALANGYDKFLGLAPINQLRSSLDQAFCGKEILENARLMREYDMSPTRENFWNFVNDDTGETLHLSPENYNILRTMVICDKGYSPEEQVNTAFLYGDGYKYDFHHKFDKIAKGLFFFKDPVQIKSLTEESKRIAAVILADIYPWIRKPLISEDKTLQTPETSVKGLAVSRKPIRESPKPVKKMKL